MARTFEPQVAYLDTHVVMWLYDKLLNYLSPLATACIEESQLLVSPLIELELQYLHEIGRVGPKPDRVLKALHSDIGLVVGEQEYATIVHHARTLSWTRDPFDRLIVGEALAAGARLITKDETIREHFSGAVW